jgi:two-component system, NarL family, nitrate/nitrite response regulator NarL
MDELRENIHPPRVSFVLADDDRLTALSLASALGRFGMKPLAVVHTAGEAISAASNLSPDILIVDLDFGPGPTGLDVAGQVRKKHPKIGIVIVSAFEDPRLLAPSLPPAPSGSIYLVKQQLRSPEQVALAAREAKARAMGGKLASSPDQRVGLSDTQIELLRLIASGLSNQAIADRLSVTQKAVEKSITRLADRLGADRSTDANLRVALTHRYLELVGYSHGQ